jgi:hypothetical protein
MLKVTIEIDGLNFFWAEKGYTWANGTPIECCWEDISYSIKRGDDTLVDVGSTTVETRLCVESEIDNLKGSLGSRMEAKFPGYVEEELNSTHYGVPFKDLVNSTEPRWCFSYEDPESEGFFQILDMINLPKNDKGVYPSYISGYIPDRVVTRANIESYMTDYIKLYKGLKEDIEFSWVGVPTDEDIERTYRETITEIEEFTKHSEEEGGSKVIILPQPLTMFLGGERVEELVNRGLVHAELVGNDEDLMYHFEDGHTELSTELSRMNDTEEN